jgi:glycine cleavage system H lipoate-binding protein/ABC-type phosphate transport system substrate-binding protein
MKTKIYLFAAILLLLSPGSLSSKQTTVTNADVKPGSIAVACTPDLYQLTSQWESQFSTLNPAMKIEVNKLEYNEAISTENENISFISDKSVACADATNWKLVVGHDIIVPFINAENPYIHDIFKQGVSREKFEQIFTNPEKRTWGTLLSVNQSAAVNIYVLNDESVKTSVTNFLKTNQISLAGIQFSNLDAVIAAVQKDPFAIGFCKAVSLQDKNSQSVLQGISLLPIDINGNGKLDYIEDIYSDMNTLQRGVWIGKYPKVLCSDIYAVSKVQPVEANTLAFIKWVLTDGQQFVNANGYSDLVSTESQSQLDKINTPLISEAPVKGSYSLQLIIATIAIVLIVVSFIISSVIRRFKIEKTPKTDTIPIAPIGFDEKSVEVPNGLYFDKTHSWAFMEKSGRVTLGIDDFLQHITGPITRIEMKNPGDRIKKGDLLFSIIQTGKQLKLYAPVSGIIKRQNEKLLTEASFLNTSPYTEGWVYEIEPSNWFKEIQLLDIAEKYKNWLNTEFSRVKDFLAVTLNPTSVEYSHAVLQDGGLLKDGILADFGPEVWEDFQTNFLDAFK